MGHFRISSRQIFERQTLWQPSLGLKAAKAGLCRELGSGTALPFSQRALTWKRGSVSSGTGSCSVWGMKPCWPPAPQVHHRSCPVPVTAAQLRTQGRCYIVVVTGTGSGIGTEGAMAPSAHCPCCLSSNHGKETAAHNYMLLQARAHCDTLWRLVGNRGHCGTCVPCSTCSK